VLGERSASLLAGTGLLAHGAEPATLPPLTPARLLTESSLAPVPVLLLLTAGGLYLWGVLALRARGDAWSPWRMMSFLAGGLGSIAAVTLTGVAAYDETLFGLHMVQHMTLTMVAPVFLALGAPVTLALRTLSRRPRSALLTVLHSRLARLGTFPLIGWLLFVGSPFALYFTGWYAATLHSALLHEVLHVHFLLVGCVFFWPLLGLDPVPGRVAHPARMLLVLATLPFHAFLGIAVMSGGNLIAGEHYRGLGLDWVDPAAQQELGGGLLWASGDLVGLLFLIVLLVQWMQASEREAAREDRRLDRLEAAGAARSRPQ